MSDETEKYTYSVKQATTTEDISKCIALRVRGTFSSLANLPNELELNPFLPVRPHRPLR